jgi:DNA-binding beta-propeller fold protein YncE
MIFSSSNKLLPASSQGVVDISSATPDFNTNRYRPPQGGWAPNGIFFKPDGTKMYVAESNFKNLMEFTLSTAWDVFTATETARIPIGGLGTLPEAVHFKSDGTKLFIVDSSEDAVYRLSLSTAWDLSTATFETTFNRFFLSFPENGNPAYEGMTFNSDGTKVYTTRFAYLVEFDLSTAWDVTTASHTVTTDLSSIATSLTAVHFKSNGTKMYVLERNSNGLPQLNEYDLSTAWDTATLTFNQTVTLDTKDTYPTSLSFNSDGTELFVLNRNSNYILKLSLSTAWDISTISTPSLPILLTTDKEPSPYGLTFKSDGTKVYVVGVFNTNVDEYDLSTAWDMSTASFNQSFDVSTQETDPRAVFFKSDGTNMYVLGTSGDDVNQYALSTAWDISTASYTKAKSISSEDLTPSGLYFKSDGTKMYVVGDAGNDVNEYDLSTAWDVATASYVQNFSVSTQDTTPRGVETCLLGLVTLGVFSSSLTVLKCLSRVKRAIL